MRRRGLAYLSPPVRMAKLKLGEAMFWSDVPIFALGLGAVWAFSASPVSAACTPPAGAYVGAGSGPVFYQGTTQLAGRNEVWSLSFPTTRTAGKITIWAKSHPRPTAFLPDPGTPDYYSLYVLQNAAVPQIGGTDPLVATTWDQSTCTGTMRVTGPASQKWVNARGETAPTTYNMDTLYRYSSANNGGVVTFSVVNQRGPFSPVFSIRLEKQ
jgi:hypothetical protein